MEKVDILIEKLEPEIDIKCAEIKKRNSEKRLTEIFFLLSAVFLIIPTLLVFLGVGLLTVFVPIIFTAAAFLAASPILISKGAGSNE